jgi:transposase
MNASYQDLQDRMESTRDKVEYMKMRAVYLHKAEKMKGLEAAKAVGTTKGQVYQWAHRYKKFGIDGLINKPRGGRTWAFMALEEEKNLLESLTNDASKGLIVITKIVKNAAEQQLGRSVSADYAEDLLNRHGWRKVAPRPKHPKSNVEEQEEFKKKRQNSLKKLRVHLTHKVIDL